MMGRIEMQKCLRNMPMRKWNPRTCRRIHFYSHRRHERLSRDDSIVHQSPLSVLDVEVILS